MGSLGLKNRIRSQLPKAAGWGQWPVHLSVLEEMTQALPD